VVQARRARKADETAAIRVLVVEGTWWWREAFLRVLERCSEGFEATAAADPVAIRRIVGQNRPDVAIVDLDNAHGLEILLELREEHDIPCLAMAAELTQETLSAALTVAASFAVKQDLDPERLCQLIAVLRTGDALLLRATRRILTELIQHGGQTPARKYGLTARETQVVALLAEGLSNAEIATRLHVSSGRVKKLVSRALGRLGVRNRTEAALIARREGIGGLAPNDSALLSL
jgi:DNA-binding NarL/FixJ family response regulator